MRARWRPRLCWAGLSLCVCSARLQTAVVLPHGDFVYAPQLVDFRSATPVETCSLAQCVCVWRPCLLRQARQEYLDASQHAQWSARMPDVSAGMGRGSCTQRRRLPTLAIAVSVRRGRDLAGMLLLFSRVDGAACMLRTRCSAASWMASLTPSSSPRHTGLSCSRQVAARTRA